MKSLTVTTLAFLASTSFASELQNSTYELRHQAKITKAVSERCFIVGTQKEISKKVQTIKIDQGLTDYKFTTVVEVKSRIDQNIFETNSAVVKSSYTDTYDQTEKEWGVYTIDSVTCLE